jgi:chaperone modulatory protein CbpM
MITLDTVLRMIEGVRAAELRLWIEEGWVRPETTRGDLAFHEIDVARVRLIYNLRRDLAIDREAMPVVLHLLDQLYDMRRRLRAVTAAIEAQPAPVRRRLKGALRPAPLPRAKPKRDTRRHPR